MKKIGDLANSSLSTIRQEKEEKVMLDPLSSQLVEQIFVKIGLICRGFDTFYADRNRLNAEKTQWILAFSKLGIRTKGQIEVALAKLELYRFPNPPQLGEFLAWRLISPQEIGFPSPEKAFQMSLLINRQFSDYKSNCNITYTVILHAIRQIGCLEYRTMSTDKAKKSFEHYYEISCKQFMDGELQEIPKAITDRPEAHPSDKKRTDEARLKAMESLRGLGLAIKRPV